MKQFFLAQVDPFEMGGGWFFLTWKTENHVNPTWDYQLGVVCFAIKPVSQGIIVLAVYHTCISNQSF